MSTAQFLFEDFPFSSNRESITDAVQESVTWCMERMSGIITPERVRNNRVFDLLVGDAITDFDNTKERRNAWGFADHELNRILSRIDEIQTT